jgi:hypothetical protein
MWNIKERTIKTNGNLLLDAEHDYENVTLNRRKHLGP